MAKQVKLNKIDISYYEDLEDFETEYDVHHRREKLASNRNRMEKEEKSDRKNARGRAWGNTVRTL